MRDPQPGEELTTLGNAPFHLSSVESIRQVVAGLEGSYLDPGGGLTELTPQEHLASNARLFTAGGSLAREFWADTALGSRIQGNSAQTATPVEMVDLCSMTCNTVLGVNDPWVKLRQAAFLLSTQPHYLPARIGSDLFYRVAHRILNRLSRFGAPHDFAINLRQCNGSDAVELALHAAWLAARGAPRRRRLATFQGGYHGESVLASLVCEDDPAYGAGRALVDRVDNVVHFPSPRCEDGGHLSAEALATLDALERDGEEYFAVLIEPIQWRNSVHAVPLEFLRRLRDVCTRKSICLVFDEVQNAFGYTGTIFFAESSDVCPDIVATGKALTSGHGALAIVVARREFAEVEAPFGSKTNSGDMLSLVAVDAVMDRLTGMVPEEFATLPTWLPPGLVGDLRDGLLEITYPRVVGMLGDFLADLQRRFPSLVGPASGVGLVRGVAMLGQDGRPSGAMAGKVADTCLKHGVYVRRAGHCLYIKPSLSTTEADFELAGARLAATFEEVLHRAAREETK
ncbi:aminotransferase class III-fold pyridoxal phosphate-dependent enzyme [Streptomyces phaeoluteigriseus]|uniref:Aminotransferase class III-fold pyridoxal phosphate-dependent enzyme n=1 Tax=Streptomyces phaeoluteigriseus TaxID=114686 RepID=A0ABY4Z9P7_9ACTN|nr:aminotransferase class III-fold pyridoxal phosphate-dependent enzyme [Streptomyces phaeoluteigriseus]USQ85762.1 aminotransferase class III-fold pyridoxal phosphate-dependent enzyme [Streptomyces phaeoluteigriseus]